MQQSEYGTPIFMISNKEGTMRFMKSIAGYIKKLVQTPYHLSIIGKTIKSLEGFQYETDIYLNMVYYTIQIYPRSRDTTAMVTEF